MIYVLPGMGADQRMYAGPWRTLPECTFLDWPRDAKEESISAIACRMVADAAIPDGAVIVGSSLGGIVACEITKIRKCRSLILVGSARRREEINGLLAMLHPLVDLAPLQFIQQASGKIPGELSGMFHTANARFIRNMCHAIFRWDGLGEGLAPVRRIHGRFDLVIPLPEGVEEVIEGGHLIAMTYPAECVRFIAAGEPAQGPVR